MSMKDIRNKPSRNGFDLSSKRNFTAKTGELLPVWFKPVIPGDVIKGNVRGFTRTQPLNTSAFARITEYYDFYFVPLETLWNRAPEVLTQMLNNAQHSSGINQTDNVAYSGSMPYFSVRQVADYIDEHKEPGLFGFSRANTSVKLLQYLGYGDYTPFLTTSWSDTAPFNRAMFNVNLNPFPLLAYQKIYNDFFRFQQWEISQPWTFNLDYIKGTNDLNIDVSSISDTSSTMFDLRYANYQKDMFFGVLPQQQFGETATVTGISDSTGNPEISILALRQAEFLQKWKEVAQAADEDYRAQIQAHWNVSVPVQLSHTSRYLGGMSQSLSINEVVNNNITGDNAAEIAGKGIVQNNGSFSFESKGEYGIIMCIYHNTPMLDLITNFMDPYNLVVEGSDYPIPEFDQIGMESVPTAWFNNSFGNVMTRSTIPSFGYAPRYIGWKTDFDRTYGAFRTSLQSWVVAANSTILSLTDSYPNSVPSYEGNDNFDSTLSVSSGDFKVCPKILDSIMSVNADESIDTDQFLIQSFFDVKVVRNLDTNGLPY